MNNLHPISHKYFSSQEEGLSEVYHMIDTDQTDADRKLRLVLEDLTIGCNKYLSISKGAGSGPGVGKTRLDRERMKMCHKEVVRENLSFEKSLHFFTPQKLTF